MRRNNGVITPLRLLLLEDRTADADLLMSELRRSGVPAEVKVVGTRAAYLKNLDSTFDAIISDFDLPQFNAKEALALLQAQQLDIPFIVVSGAIGEETAVDLMRLGAADYLLKDRLARLPQALARAVEARLLRAERLAVQQQLLLQSTAVEAAGNAILVTNRSGAILLVNPAFTALTGYTAEEVLGKTPRVLKSGKHDQAFYRKLWKTILSGQTWRGEFTNRRKDGSLFYDEHTITPVRSEGGEITHFIGIMHDVTERKRVEERVQEQARMLDQAHDAIIVRDIHTGQITFWNQGAERLYGWAAAEAVGRDIGKLIFADPSALEAVTEQLLKTGEWHGEHNKVSKAGEKLTVSSHATLVRDADGHPKSALVINIDITEQKDLEARFLRAQRIESIGTLASGVAHDLNNILAPILMGAAVLRRTEMPEPDEAILSTIETCAQRGADIVKQVLTFARGAEGARLLLQPAHLINDMAKIAEETFPKTITVRTGFSQSLWPIEGDPTQLHQVLLNLSVNARDAMPNGGTLTLSAENFPVDEHYASMTPGAKAGPHVLFEVIDMGMGISREVIDKIFDPFFTTKEIGHGTGLGLSTVIGVVKNHGGFVSVYSEIGRGTTFKVFLPARMGALETLKESEATALPPPANGELLLIVDDEKPILQVARALLQGYGYRVLTAGDAPEALAIFALRMEEIKLVLADLAMPIMDGIALIRTLKKMKPEVRIIASTGLGGQEQRVHELAGLNVRTCLTKPYNKHTLLTILHDALGAQKDEQ